MDRWQELGEWLRKRRAREDRGDLDPISADGVLVEMARIDAAWTVVHGSPPVSALRVRCRPCAPASRTRGGGVMGVSVTYSCNGCDATHTAQAPVDIDPIGREMVRVIFPSIQSLTPEGWWAYDPYTHATYCPTCRAEIMAPSPHREAPMPDRTERVEWVVRDAVGNEDFGVLISLHDRARPHRAPHVVIRRTVTEEQVWPEDGAR